MNSGENSACRGSTLGPKRLRDLLRHLAWLAATGFLLNGNWEWLQGPLYTDRTASLEVVIWYRFHCTLGDVLILLGSALLLSAALRDARWLGNPQWRHLVLLSVLGTAYTALSEQVNVGLRRSWAYSELMPVIPGTSIGLAPLLQWMLLPAAAALLTARLAR